MCIKISEDAVLKKLQRLKFDKSQGPDEVRPMMIVLHVYNIWSILQTEYYTTSWLEVCQHFSHLQKGSKSDASNYRPVSLTSVLCRIIESIMAFQLLHGLAPPYLNQLNSTQLNFIVTYLQLNSWIAKYSSICRPIHVQYNRIKSPVIQ